MRVLTRLLIAVLFLLMAVGCSKECVEPEVLKVELDKNRVRPCAGCMPGGRLDTVIRRNFK